ncbi:MAG: tripartite tricarboxylate transporter TctB family protein [Thermodesulfobacteriota bacterium]
MARDKAELFTAVVVICLGIFFLLQAYQVETVQRALIGPRLVPMEIAGMIIGLGVLQFIVIWVSRAENVKDCDSGTSDSETSPTAAGVSTLVCTAPVFRTLAVIVIGFAYIWLFSATGYLIATAITMALLLVLFGTRNPTKVALITIGGTAVYYFIFIWLIGIYDPPGTLINLKILGL